MGKHRTTLQEEIIAEVTNRLNQLDVIPEVLMVRLPQPAFRRGGHAVAATKIKDIAGARRTILEGGGTPQFIEHGRKYTLIPR